MTRRMITKPDGSLLNTCTSDAIIQILRFLKRAYWPFAWDSSQGLAADSRGLGIGGGFADAAKVWKSARVLMQQHHNVRNDVAVATGQVAPQWQSCACCHNVSADCSGSAYVACVTWCMT